ncbi:MAG: acetylglutamate kinase [Chloroflexi bacterium]|nr:acetylglutamate kinase [Chloroflexota bacterium]
MALNVIKLGGNEIDSAEFLSAFVQAVAAAPEPPVLIHGGGKEITALGNRLGMVEKRIEGLRVTDADYLQVVEMMLGGVINKRLVRALNLAGANAIGLTGADLNLMRAEKLLNPHGDLGFVGHITTVNGEAIRMFTSRGIVPVVAPIGFGFDGQPYNINADHAALALAQGVNADALMFVTNVPGVKIDGAVVPHLSLADVEAQIASGQINGGMIPKARSAVEAVSAGVRSVVICDLDGLRRSGGGTIIS